MGYTSESGLSAVAGLSTPPYTVKHVGRSYSQYRFSTGTVMRVYYGDGRVVVDFKNFNFEQEFERLLDAIEFDYDEDPDADIEYETVWLEEGKVYTEWLKGYEKFRKKYPHESEDIINLATRKPKRLIVDALTCADIVRPLIARDVGAVLLRYLSDYFEGLASVGGPTWAMRKHEKRLAKIRELEDEE